MTRVLLEADAVRVPGWVTDLESFRRWTDAGNGLPVEVIATKRSRECAAHWR